MVDLITLSLVKYSDGNIAICQLHSVNNGDLNGYTKAMIITMTAIIIALQLGVYKSRMAHNDLYWRRSGLLQKKLIRSTTTELTTNVHTKH